MTLLSIAQEGARLEQATERAFYEHGDGSQQWLDALDAFERHAKTHPAALCRAVIDAGEREAALVAEIKAAMERANGRWCEWSRLSERAEMVRDLIEAALDKHDARSKA